MAGVRKKPMATLTARPPKLLNAFHLSDGAAVTIMGPHSSPDGPYPVTVPGVGGTYISPGPDHTPFKIVGKLELTSWAKSPTTGAQIPTGWKFTDVQILPREDGKKPPHANMSWTATPWHPTPVGMFANLCEYVEGGADIEGAYDGHHVPFHGRGFCESVGFEPTATFLPRLWNGIQVEFPEKMPSPEAISEKLASMSLHSNPKAPQVHHLQAVTCAVPVEHKTPGYQPFTTTISWAVEGAARIHFNDGPNMPPVGHEVFHWAVTAQGPQKQNVPHTLIIEAPIPEIS